jgi:hypothetical protein
MKKLIALGAAVAALTFTASASAAPMPTAPGSGQQIADSSVVLRWSLEPGWRTSCIEWSDRPETSYPGGPFLAPENSECFMGPQDVAYLFDNLGTGRYYWHVRGEHETCAGSEPETYYDDCPTEEVWGPTAYFDSIDPTPTPAAEPPADDMPSLPGYRFCGWRKFTRAGGWTLTNPGSGAYTILFARKMTCKQARRNMKRVRYSTKPPYRPRRAGYRCVRLENGYEYSDVRCSKRERKRVAFRYQTGS